MSSAAPSNTPRSPTLVGTLWPASAGDAETRAAGWPRLALLIVLGSLLLTVSAKVQVPFYPVPMTLQTLAVLVLGAAYGWRLATATVLAYGVEGVLGLPLFAGPAAGPGYLLGPTGGFILGFAAAAAFVGWFCERGWDRPLGRLVALMVAGHAIVFAFGLPWLSLFTGFPRAWALGAQPFLLATLLKTALAVALIRAGWTLLRR